MQNSRKKFAEHLQKICRKIAGTMRNMCEKSRTFAVSTMNYYRSITEALPKHSRSIAELFSTYEYRYRIGLV